MSTERPSAVNKPPLPIAEPLFYCPAMDNDGDIVLTGEEARHVGVQRLRAGGAIALLDGRGKIARGTIQTIGRHEVRVTVEQRYHEPPPVPRLSLYSAVPKGDRIAVLLDMATQLGMSRFTPLYWRRSVVEPGKRAQARWERICLEACKQSRRAWLPEIAPPVSFEQAAERAKASGDCLIVAHPGGDAKPLLTMNFADDGGVALFVGPEGGLTDDEAEALRRQNARFVHLGPAILRIETAAVALLALAAARGSPESPGSR